MHASLATAQDQPQGRAAVGKALTALCKIWAAYTLKRTIADVASNSDQDYRAFGLDKAEMLKALEQLRHEIQHDGTFATADADRNRIGTGLAIVVTKREPRPASMSVLATPG